jgi:hypothetical protein
MKAVKDIGLVRLKLVSRSACSSVGLGAQFDLFMLSGFGKNLSYFPLGDISAAPRAQKMARFNPCNLWSFLNKTACL